MRNLLILLIAAGISSFAADVAGKWKGEVSRPDGTPQTAVVLDLRQDGDKLTGRVGESEDSTAPLANVKLEGDKLNFDVETSNSVFKVAMTVDGDTMKGTVIRSRDGQDSPPLPIAVKRSK